MATPSTESIIKPQQRRHEEMMRLLESRNVSFGSTLLEPKKSPGKAGEKGAMKLITNAHILKLLGKQTIYHYEVTINAVSRSDKKLRVSEPNGPRDRDDFPLLNRRDKCREVFLAFYSTMEVSLKASGNLLYYDLAKTIFTLKKLQIETEAKYMFNIGTVPTAERPDAAFFKHYEFIIKPATGFEIDDLSFITNDTSKMERSLEQFLDIATAQMAKLNANQFIGFSASRVYLLAPTDYGFRSNECPLFDANHSFLGIGVNKGCRIIEGEQGTENMTPGIVIQSKKSAFHIPNMCVLEKAKVFLVRLESNLETGVLSQNDYDSICTGLVGIYAEPRYGPSGRFFRIDDITKPNGGNGHNAENTYINHHTSGHISVQRYFSLAYQKELQYPKAPLLINHRRMGDLSYFPMELCFVLDGQRVKGTQQAPNQLRDMITVTAVAPAVLKEHNERVKDSLRLVNNEYLTKASVHFENAPLHVDYRIIGAPRLAYRGEDFQRPEPTTCEWRSKSYVLNATIGIWVAYAFAARDSDSARRNEFSEGTWRTFVTKYASEMIAKGIVCGQPRHIFVHWGTTANDVLNLLRKEVEHQAEFALIGHSKSSDGDDVHTAIKVLEQQTEIVTQSITFDVFSDILNKGSTLTLANCIHKTNMKMGGLNYALSVDDPLVASLFDGQTLFLGFAMNFPGGFVPTEPANNSQQAVGIAHVGSNGNAAAAAAAANGTANGATAVAATGANVTPLGTNGNSKTQAVIVKRGASVLPPPACIGWAATIGSRHKDEYVGDFVFQAPRREEKIDVIASVVKRCIEQFTKYRKAHPKRIIILRNGCTEGQFEYIMKYEIPLVKKEMEELGCTAKLTVIVPNRLQDVRFVRQDANPEDRSSEQNIRPGTVVDTVVVHPKRNEFFLNSHVAIKGTARTPHYTLLKDENDLSMDALQTMAHHLCFGHQIVTKPTSLPSPVYIAEEYAKRGRNIYSHYAKNGIDHSKSLEKIVKEKGVPWPLNNYADMTKVLSYVGSSYLFHHRVNA